LLAYVLVSPPVHLSFFSNIIFVAGGLCPTVLAQKKEGKKRKNKKREKGGVLWTFHLLIYVT
jgi:hypothetical protein